MNVFASVTIAILTLTTVALLYVLYRQVKKDGAEEVKSEAKSDALKRVQDAVRSGDAVRPSVDRLRDNDGHRRD